MNKKFYFLITFVFTVGCQQSADTPKTSLWHLKEGQLSFLATPIIWSETSQLACDKCKIVKDRTFYPFGPIENYFLLQSGQFKAAKGKTIAPWLRLKSDKASVKIPLLVELKERQIFLLSEQKRSPLANRQAYQFTYQGEAYQLWVEAIRFYPQSKNLAKEQPDFSLHFTLLSLD